MMVNYAAVEITLTVIRKI